MSDYLWTVDELIRATGGTLHGDVAGINGLAFDSREAKAGDLFLALKSDSEAGDGHNYVASAAANGAALSLVSHLIDNAGPQLLVANTTKALNDIAIDARSRAPAKRAAVTGSVGKTGTTRAIEACLAAAGPAHGPVGSFNNHIGVPLTLARMPRTTQRAVFELGMNHAGELTPLSQLVQPQVALITTVGAVHAEHFPDGEEGIARAKGEIFAGLQPGGLAVLNRDNQWYDLLEGLAKDAGARIASFGAHESATARLTGSHALDDGLQIEAVIDGAPVSFSLRQHGSHWALNSLGILLVLDAMDVSRETAVAALKNFAPLAGRGENHTIPLTGGSFRMIDESYNANPISMKATLDYLGTQAGRKIAVLTDMLELGPRGAEWHADIARMVEDNKIDLVYAAGPLMQNLWDALPQSRRGGYAEKAADLIPELTQSLQPNDVVLVKGSKGSKAASIAAALVALKNPGKAA